MRRPSIGTGVDVLCATPSGRPVVVELKCGYDRHWLMYQGKMLGPLKFMVDSPFCQAMTQLAITAYLYGREAQLKRAYLLRVHSNGKDYTMNRLVEQLRQKPILLDMLEVIRCKKRSPRQRKKRK